MLVWMRTTLVIQDDVFRRAKQRAAERGLTMSEVVSRALQESLRREETVEGRPFAMPVFGRAGNAVERDLHALAALRDEGAEECRCPTSTS